MSNKFLQEYPDSDLNKLSPKIEAYLEEKQLVPGVLTKYRILKRTKNLNPQRKAGEDWLYPSSMLFNLKDKILKPEGGILNIGVVKEFDSNTGNFVFKNFVHVPQKGDGGFFFLSGSNLGDVENFPLIELSNKNGSNPFRDESVTPTYERVDEGKEGKERSSKRNYLKDSLNAIDRWSVDEMKIIGASYNLSTSLDKDALKDKLEEIAEKSPKEFYDQIDSEDTKIKAIIKLAIEAEIIAYSAHEHRYFYPGSNETVAILDRREGVTEQQQFAQFLKSSANGQNIREKLSKQIKTKKSNS